jgi:nucleoside-diphosphate-sugar epimerase
MIDFLITGGAGFIGSNLAIGLLERGNTVRVLDNFSTGKIENLGSVMDDVEVVEGDVRDLWTVLRAVRGVEFVIHLAALPSVQRSVRNPLTSNEVNVNGTLHVLEAARLSEVHRVIFASSSSVYGDGGGGRKVETQPPRPLSPYAISKLAAEEYCRNFHRLYGLETVALRYFNVFGPRQDPSSEYAAVIPRFVAAALNGCAPTVYGDGEQTRDFTFIENVVDAIILACRAPDAAGEVFNVACGEQHSLNELLREIEKISGVQLNPEYVDPRPGDIRHSLADITKAKSTLGYAATVPFREGLRRTYEWMCLAGE